MEAVECGAASLAMVLAFHGHHAPLSEVRLACGISRDGSTAKNIVAAATTYGLEPVPVRLEPADLADCEDPAILHWDMNHFVVLERWTPKGAWIVDPGVGRRFIPTELFDESFTGICILFELGDEFEERPREPISAGRYLALLRGAGPALAMVLFASLAVDVLATVTPLTTQIAIDHVIGRHRVDWLFLVGASAAAFVVFSSLWSLLRGSLLVRIRARLDVAITQQFVGHLLALPVAFFGQRSVADLMARVQANRTIRELLAGQSVGLLADGVMLLAYLGLMFAFDASLSWLVLVAGVAYVVVFLVGRPYIRAGADEVQRADVLASSALLQILRGITTIKSAGVERTSRVRWLNAWIASLNVSARNALQQQTVQTVLLAIQAIVPIVILLVGGRRVLDGQLTPGRLVAFQMLQAGFLMPLQAVVRALLGLQIVPVLLGRMDDVLLSETEPTRSLKCPRLEGGIELRNVTFRYSPTSPAILDDVSLRIEPGKKVAFVGPSGSGKSTLARLLLGLYLPTEGEVLLDGHDLATLDLTSVRRQYGVVLQETALFDGTIADNLRLFHPTAPQEHLVQAARVAQIHDDILALPRGYETRISAAAGTLSGGQRQRLALARAIVHRPPIMILDEATSALDAVTEGAIERYLSTRACTRVVIAHRLSTVRDADTIFVVDCGQIVERGRHDELLATGGLYARLVAEEHKPRAVSSIQPERQPITAEELASFDVLRAWSAEERAELADQLQRADFPEDTRVVEQDARATGLYLIVEGTVAIELAEPGLAAWTVAELGAGSIFGEAGLLDGSPSSASVVARSPVRLLHLPYGPFQELLRKGDVLAARAVLSLGAIVAERMRDAVRRRDQLAGGIERRDADEAPRAAPPLRGRRELALGETLLGASLDADEVEALEGTGARVALRPGQVLFAPGDAADTLFVLRSGSVAVESVVIGTLSVVDAGAILGETSAFDGGPHVTSAVAIDEVVVTALGREALVELLLSGQRVARKLLSPIAETLARRFRLANYRLREAVALEHGELDRAHAAREQALEAAREEREALGAAGDGPVPVVLARDPGQSGAACLTALLRAAGRPTSMPAVVEALAAAGGGALTQAWPEVARSFGLESRKLEVPLADLRALDAPIVAMVEDEGAIVLERRDLRGWHVMDPRSGRRVVPEDELASTLTGTAFEIRDPSQVPALATLPQRAAIVARGRLGAIGRLVAITLALQGIVMGMSLATALAIQRVFPLGDRPLLAVVVAAGAALAVAYAVMQQLQGRAIEHLRAHLDRELLDQLMTHILKLPIAFFDRFPPGEVLQRFQAFANVRSLFSTQGVAVLLSVVSLVVAGILLVSFAPHMFFVAVVVLLLYAAATALLFRTLRRAAADEVSARGRQQDRLIEILQGITTLRMASDVSAAEQRWLPSFLEELSASLRRDRTLAIVIPALDGIRGLSLVACVWLGTRGVLDGSLSIGALVGFLAVFATFLEAVHALTLQIASSAPSLVDYGLVRATFAEPLEQSAGTLLSPGQLRGRINVDQVSFRYTADGPLVLRDVSLQIESGMKVALVGASGSGKSTLGRLLLGLYLPTSGRILFDGKDVSSLDLEALRRRMGVVLQEPFLLPGTIRENIALGAEGATLDRVAEAAQNAAIHDDIERMPMGYETIVSEGGTTFSGGQRQRLIIARALVSSPAVLLLDEATSALDNFSQALIERHLARSTATRIVIAHRLSTVVDADRIVVLHKGSVVEQGTHEDLLARQGPYYDLVRAQIGAGEEVSAR
jgi:ABC-type bacteriocin/lantibiotic exporter with double-glycine peptidase domain/CRP-like cAMP-binding protein